MARKYHNVPTKLDGKTFASKREANRWAELLLLQRAGQIRELEPQPRFPLKVNDVLVCTYVGDFRYVETRTGETVIEDAKGVKTPAYRIKKKLMLAVYGIAIVEV